MMAAIRSEFRKLLSVRSTYGIIIFCLGFTIFLAFYIFGYKQTAEIVDPGALASAMTNVVQFLSFVVSFAAVLLFTHEYRYNTITYTMTAARNRTTVLLAKIVAISVFSVILVAALALLAPFLMSLGLQAKGIPIAAQNLNLMDLLPRAVFYGWFYSMFALLIAAIVRNQVGTFAIVFLYPGLVEQLLTLVLKTNSKYLPFIALDGLLQNGTRTVANGVTALSHSSAMILLLGYLVFGWAVAWLLFVRRDAN